MHTWRNTYDEYSSKNMDTVIIIQFIYEYKP